MNEKKHTFQHGPETIGNCTKAMVCPSIGNY